MAILKIRGAKLRCYWSRALGPCVKRKNWVSACQNQTRRSGYTFNKTGRVIVGKWVVDWLLKVFFIVKIR
jgi:hypothetical protein